MQDDSTERQGLLRGRKVAEWGVTYLAGAWLLWQGTDVFAQRWGLSDELLRRLDLVLIGGLFATLGAAWVRSRSSAIYESRRTVLYSAIALGLLGVVLLFLRLGPLGEAAQPPGISLSAVAPARPALAVLPFEDQTGAPEGRILTDGIHDELRTALSRINGLKVFSPNSVDDYRESTKAAVQIGAELGAGYLLEGSVQRSGELVRLVAFLVDATDGSQLWASPFERAVREDDLFAAIGSMAVTVAKELEAVISDDEVRRIALRSTSDFRAFEAYMRGYAVTNDYVEAPRSRFEEGVRNLESAVAIDPSFALAWAALAGAHGWVVLRSWDNSPARKEATRGAAARAIELQPDLPEAHYAMATYYYRVERDYDAALSELARVESSLRGDGAANLLRAYIHRRMGDAQAALYYLEQARDLDPRSDVPVMQAAGTLMRAGEWEEARSYAQRALALNPQRASNGHRIARIRYSLGEGLEELREYYRRTPQPYLPHWGWLIEFRDRNWREAHAYLDAWPEAAFDEQDYFAPVDLLRAWTAAAQGDSLTARRLFVSAEQVLRELSARAPHDFRYANARAQSLVGAGRVDKGAQEALRALELMPPEADQVSGTLNLGEVVLAVAGANDPDTVVPLLDSLFALPFDDVPSLFLADPRLDPIRGSVAFQQLLGRHSAGGG